MPSPLSLSDSSSTPAQTLKVFPFGKNGNFRKVPLAPYGSPQDESID